MKWHDMRQNGGMSERVNEYWSQYTQLSKSWRFCDFVSSPLGGAFWYMHRIWESSYMSLARCSATSHSPRASKNFQNVENLHLGSIVLIGSIVWMIGSKRRKGLVLHGYYMVFPMVLRDAISGWQQLPTEILLPDFRVIEPVAVPFAQVQKPLKWFCESGRCACEKWSFTN